MKSYISTIICTLGILVSSISQAENIEINGAGASFPYPIYAKWAYRYNQNTGTKINYQSIGSGGGIAQIKASTVDFGASDEPLKIEALNESGLVQFPLVMGGVTPVVNIEGIEAGKLKLSSDVLADILLGKIVSWNDPKIKELNPDLNLPEVDITVVYRSDGSGTTWIFTNYLTKISADWDSNVGGGKSVAWPVGVGAKGNEGVANYVKRVNGAIGYVEYAYAIQNKLAYIQLKNQAGTFVEPTMEAFQAAAENADWQNAPGFYVVLTNQPGDKSWSITGASYILIHKEIKDPAKAKELLQFFNWCYQNGAEMAKELHYIPMPPTVVELVTNAWAQEIKSNGQQVWKK